MSKHSMKLDKADCPGLRLGETEVQRASVGQNQRQPSCTAGLCCFPSPKGCRALYRESQRHLLTLRTDNLPGGLVPQDAELLFASCTYAGQSPCDYPAQTSSRRDGSPGQGGYMVLTATEHPSVSLSSLPPSGQSVINPRQEQALALCFCSPLW